MLPSVRLSDSVELRPCDPDADGEFIRTLSRANFFDIISRTVGWDEARHQAEPQDPSSYHIVYVAGERAGFVCLRNQPDCLYLSTIQLLPAVRGRGIGTLLMRHIEDIARSSGVGSIQLHVFASNRALSLYTRLGYKQARQTQHGQILAKSIDGAERSINRFLQAAVAVSWPIRSGDWRGCRS